MIVPAMGLPIRMPAAAKQNDIPIHVPTKLILGTNEATTADGKDTTAPETKPYRMAKTIRPPRVSMTSPI